MIEQRIRQATFRGAGTLELLCTPDPLPAGFGITHRWEPYTANLEPGDTLGSSPILSSLVDLIGTAHMVPNAMGSTGATGAPYQIVNDVPGLAFGAPRRLMTPLDRSQPHTLVALVRPASGISALSAILGASTTAGSRGSLYLTSDGRWAMNAGNTLTNPAAVKGGQWQVAMAVFNGSNSVIRIDGQEVAGNAGTEAADRLILGSMATLSAALNGYLSSPIYAPVAWDAIQRADYETWLREINQLPPA